MKKTKNKNLKTSAIPEIKELTKDEIIQIYKDELKRKDDLIVKLENENKLLLDLTMKNTKKRLEELDLKIKDASK